LLCAPRAATPPRGNRLSGSAFLVGWHSATTHGPPGSSTRLRSARVVAADDPAHRRIMAQTFGVVHILVPGEATKYRLSEQPGQCVPTILASARIGQHITRHHGQADCVVEFAICHNPASDVTTEPRKCTVSRRSKSSL